MPRRSHLAIIAERQACLGERMIPYTVKRSSQAAHVRFEIKTGTGLTVVIPRNCKVEIVDEMLVAKTRWILEKYDRYVGAIQSSEHPELEFGDTVPYLGSNVRVVSCRGIGFAGRIQLWHDCLLIGLDSGGDGLVPLVEGWYRTQAASVLKHKVDEFASLWGVSYRRLVVRGQRTRWGSCSHKGTLSFNWRLLMAPEPVVDYVVIHELAHLKEMNHTKKFWALVAERCPKWRDRKNWLDDHGTELAALLRSPSD